MHIKHICRKTQLGVSECEYNLLLQFMLYLADIFNIMIKITCSFYCLFFVYSIFNDAVGISEKLV
jgi:hypothetical protein